MANKPKNGGGLLSPITLPRELMERLANVLARYVALRPRMYPTRSALVREALVRGLDSLEPELVHEEARRNVGRSRVVKQ